MKKFKVGVIGIGNVSPMHCVSILNCEQAELVAVCDNKPERAQSGAERYGCAAYTDYKQMIDEADIDVVHVVTPHYQHAPMVIYAAQKGKHVLTEKPMSITVEDAEAMIKACEDAGVTLGVIFQNRYNPGSQLIKQALESGSLGKIKGGKCFITWDRSDEYYSRSDWKGTWDKEGGGVIIDQAIHTLDLLRWFVDDEIEYVDAQIGNRAHAQIEVEDTAEGVIKYKKGTVTGFWAVNYYSYDAPVEIELHCEHGLVKMVGDRATIRYNSGKEESWEHIPGEELDFGAGAKQYWGVNHSKQINAFYRSLAAGETPWIDGREALKTQKMVAAIYESGKTSKRIYL